MHDLDRVRHGLAAGQCIGVGAIAGPNRHRDLQKPKLSKKQICD
jgi:hypothetical protein